MDRQGGAVLPEARPSVRWLATADEYAAAADSPLEEPIPLLCPPGGLAARWEEVLSQQYGDPLAPCPGVRVVVAWSPEGGPAAELYAQRSGSDLVPCATLHDCLTAIRDREERHVMIVGLSERFTVRAVADILGVAREARKTVGILAGRDLARLSFSVAKSLLRPRAGLTGVQLFDAPSHQEEENLPTPPEELVRLLEQPALAKVLRAHGEGGHAKFPGLVTCGVLEDSEFPSAPAAGCGRHPRRCKRAAASGATVVFGDELRAAVICFVCCNGCNIAGELYPSPVSLALSFLEGWAGAVIAPLRPLVAPDELITEFRDGMSAGVPLGELVERLNAISERNGDRDAFVLLGDPRARAEDIEEPLERLVEKVPLPSHGSLELQEWLTRLLTHAERGRRVLRAARAWLGERPDEALVSLERRFVDIERLTINAIKWAQTNPTGAAGQRLARSVKLLRLGVSRWDDAAARLLLESRATLDPFDIGHYDQMVAAVAPGEPCPRCGTPTEIQTYGLGEPAEHVREARLCLVCGPLSEARRRGVSVVIEDMPGVATVGDSVPLRLRLGAPSDPPAISDHIHLRLRCFDKATNHLIHDEAAVLPAEDQTVGITMTLADGVGLDLHSVRAVAVSAFDVAYARGRLACLPRGAAPDRSRPAPSHDVIA